MTTHHRSPHLVLVDGNDEQLLERLHLDQSVAEALTQLDVNQLQVLQDVGGGPPIQRLCQPTLLEIPKSRRFGRPSWSLHMIS